VIHRNSYALASVIGRYSSWLGVVFWLARARKIKGFVYDEQEPALVTTMDISTMMRQI
jgi:hypothetical protein